MANYIFSYDLNGKKPTHSEMDEHITKKKAWSSGRLLETVWYIGTDDTSATVTKYLTSILSDNDSYLVATCEFMEFENLLVNSKSLVASWSSHS